MADDFNLGSVGPAPLYEYGSPPDAPPKKKKTGDSGQDYLSRLKTLDAEKSKEMAPLYKRTEDTAEKSMSDEDRAWQKVEPLKLPDQPQAGAYQTDPLKAFGSSASLFAVIASAFTHQPAVNSMNAMAAGINAIHEGDESAYKKAYEAWKDNTQLAIDKHKLQLEDYNAIRERSKDNMELMSAEVKAHAAKFEDPTASLLAEAGLWKELQQLNDSRAKSALDMQEQAQRIEENQPKALAAVGLSAAMKEAQAAVKSGDPAKIRAAADKVLTARQNVQSVEQAFSPTAARLSMTEEQAQAVEDYLKANPGKTRVDAIQAITGGTPASPDEQAASAAQAATGQPLTQIVPGWGKEAVSERKKARSDALKMIQDQEHVVPEEAGRILAQRSIEFLAGKASVTQLKTMLGATKAAVKQLDFNIGRAKQEMQKLPSTDLSPLLNGIARGEEKWTGDPAYSSLYFYLQGAATESARIMSGGQASRAQLQEGARKEAQEWASINMTPASFDAVGEAMHAEGANRVQNFEETIQSQLPGKPDETAPASDDGWSIKKVE